MRKEYFVYIIRNKSGWLYTGFTTDLKRRLREHNENTSGYTKFKGPWEIAWFGVFEERQLAEDFEKYLKGGSGFALARKRLVKA